MDMLEKTALLHLTTKIVSAYVTKNPVAVAGKSVRKQVGEYEQRWPPGKALLLWVGLSLVLWGLIIGGLFLLF